MPGRPEVLDKNQADLLNPQVVINVTYTGRPRGRRGWEKRVDYNYNPCDYNKFAKKNPKDISKFGWKTQKKYERRNSELGSDGEFSTYAKTCSGRTSSKKILPTHHGGRKKAP